MLTQVLAQEVWPHGIDVNEVVPGPVLTRLTEGVFRLDAPPPFAPSERVKPPEEVAELILWLATRPPGGPTGQSFSLARRLPLTRPAPGARSGDRSRTSSAGGRDRGDPSLPYARRA